MSIVLSRKMQFWYSKFYFYIRIETELAILTFEILFWHSYLVEQCYFDFHDPYLTFALSQILWFWYSKSYLDIRPKSNIVILIFEILFGHSHWVEECYFYIHNPILTFTLSQKCYCGIQNPILTFALSQKCYFDIRNPILTFALSGKILFQYSNIGITHSFSCISNCRVPRKLFEHEAPRPGVQISSEGPGKCFCNEITMNDSCSCITYDLYDKLWRQRPKGPYKFHINSSNATEKNNMAASLENCLQWNQIKSNQFYWYKIQTRTGLSPMKTWRRIKDKLLSTSQEKGHCFRIFLWDWTSSLCYSELVQWRQLRRDPLTSS